MTHLGPHQIDQVLLQLLNATTQEEARRLFLASGWLITDKAAQSRLAELIAVKRRERDLWTLVALITCRGFLQRCQTQSIDLTLQTQSAWPLALQGPLPKLLRLTGDSPADVRIRQGNLALQDIEPEYEPDLHGIIHYNLGLGYQAKADTGSSDALTQAVYHFDAAIRAWGERDSLFGPRFSGRARENLGRLYLQKRYGDRSQDVERALFYFEEAQKIFGEGAPELLNVSILMGDAYLERIKGERLENIELGIHYYLQARNLAEQENNVQRLGDAEHNLAVAYRVRLKGYRADNYEQAKTWAERALARFDQQASAEDWAQTAAELATIYGHRQRGDRKDNLEKGIEYAQQALEIYHPDTHPRQWTLVQLTLGNLYCDTRQNRRALHCFGRILKKTNRETDPLRWAEAMNNMGTVYAGVSKRPRDMAYRKAVKCFRQALEVRQPETLPAHARRTATNWGNLAFRFGQWNEALNVFQTALAAGEALFGESGTEAGRRVELAESAGLAANTAFCLLKLNQPTEALVQLEQGKTRLLTEALALGSINLTKLPPAQQQAIQEVQTRVRELQVKMRLIPETPGDANEIELGKLLVQAHAELKTLIETIRQDHPGFMPMGLDEPDILKLIPSSGALVAPLVTSQGSVLFVVPHGAKTMTAEHVVRLDDFTADDLTHLLVGTADEPGWLQVYLTYLDVCSQAGAILAAYQAGRASAQEREEALAKMQAATERWKSAIKTFTGQLWRHLIGPLHQRLQALKLASSAPILIMLQGGLGLLPLHAAWREVKGTKRAFLDDYEVTYTPSAYALHISQLRLRENPRHQHSLLAVVNPTQDLTYAPSEGKQIVKCFADQKTFTLPGKRATLTTVQQQSQAYTYLHFACHGQYDWQDVMQSRLQLADGSLTLAEIISNFNLNQARLVTLSACETGLTEFQQTPDEYIGLPAGFLQAGAPGVVSTLWAVNDLSTALLMERFYLYHLQGDPDNPTAGPLPISSALRQAQIWLHEVTARQLRNYLTEAQTKGYIEVHQAIAYRRDYDDWPDEAHPFESPYYWAAFTISGA